MRLKASPEDFVVIEEPVPELSDGPYHVYQLTKKEWNTEDVLQYLAQSLHISRKDIGYCGNKDKNAVTEQYITVKNGPKELRGPKDTTITYIGTRKEPLRLGMHTRNHFRIVVRDLPAGTKTPELGPIKNYFGEQRFGKDNVTVGIHLLRREYKAAVKALGLPETNDPISALRTVPKHTLLLYVHAVQSLIWNELARTLPAVADDVPLPGFGPEGNPDYLPALEAIMHKHELSRESFINKSFPELSLEGRSRPLLQDVTDFDATPVVHGVCTVSFTLGKGSYATETVAQLFSQHVVRENDDLE